MTKRDYVLALISGLLTGLFLQPTLHLLDAALPFGLDNRILIVAVPMLWVLGMLLGDILGRVIPVMRQFAKYVAAGFLSASVDFGVLNFLLAYLGVTQGVWYAVSKGASFVCGNINAYIWNRLWVFGSRPDGVATQHDSVQTEYGRFLIVSVVGFLINVGVAAFIVNTVGVRFGFSDHAWANIGAVVAGAISIVWNFTGYKLIVFRKR